MGAEEDGVVSDGYFDTTFAKMADRELRKREQLRVLSVLTTAWQTPANINIKISGVGPMQVGHLLSELGDRVEARKGNAGREWRLKSREV